MKASRPCPCPCRQIDMYIDFVREGEDDLDSHVLINIQRVGLLSEIVRTDESTCFGGVVVFGAVHSPPYQSPTQHNTTQHIKRIYQPTV